MAQNSETTPSGQSTDHHQKFPSPEGITVKAKQLSHEEKLKEIQKDVLTLYDFCKSKGFTEDNLAWCLKPFNGNPPEIVSDTFKKNKKFLFSIFLVVFCISAVMYHTPTYRRIITYSRLGMIKFHYNFSTSFEELLGDSFCLLPNFMMPNATGMDQNANNTNTTKEDCASCLDLVNKTIERLSNVSHEEMTNVILDMIPVVIEDGLQGWLKSNITLPSLHKEYTTNEKLSNLTDCRFNTSLSNINNVHEFFNVYGNGSLPEEPYYALWENCELPQAKVFRLYYKRPYYLPLMVDVGRTNNIIAGRGFLDVEDGMFIGNEDMGQGIWTTVLTGQLSIKLLPPEDCQEKFKCVNTTVLLKPGESIFVPLGVNNIYYAPNSSEDTVALGTMLSWDVSEG